MQNRAITPQKRHHFLGDKGEKSLLYMGKPTAAGKLESSVVERFAKGGETVQ